MSYNLILIVVASLFGEVPIYGGSYQSQQQCEAAGVQIRETMAERTRNEKPIYKIRFICVPASRP